MGLILRVDVDKPYGRNSSFQKIKSKLTEDYWFPKLDFLGYLKATEDFIKYCNDNGVKGFFYFRNCTVPNKKIRELLEEGGHKLGFHAENTRSLETFQGELNTFQKSTSGIALTSFTKHGSGFTKLGRNHYAPYEEDKYREWAGDVKVKFPFGNAIGESKGDFENIKDFYPKMFWMHSDYRHKEFPKVEDAIEASKKTTVPVIIHPSNFIADPFVREEFQKLVSLSKEQGIDWVVESCI